jgi:hypothetical protein
MDRPLKTPLPTTNTYRQSATRIHQSAVIVVDVTRVSQNVNFSLLIPVSLSRLGHGLLSDVPTIHVLQMDLPQNLGRLHRGQAHAWIRVSLVLLLTQSRRLRILC